MDWVEFFEKTRQAAGVESFAKLAPKLGISDGAISHYRTGKRVPQVWVVAECLKIQGHPQPEKAAIQIMKSEAQTSPERHFWKRLAATAMALCLAVGFALPHKAQAAVEGFDNAHGVYIMRNHGWIESALSSPPHGNGWASGSALACALSPRPSSPATNAWMEDPDDCHNGNAPDPTAVRPYFPTRTPAISRSPPKMPLIPGSAPKTPSISGSTSSSPLSSQLRT
ncbi:hypothetical protein I5U67_05215 [Stenotrophomonas maltophilia]|uniref:Uncharacterized protein n=1 Tax=Stenotrophomonas maltophilia TaxID=40324 RepID=A0A6B8J8E9_STEMA|nr:DUF3693 domain-containing protein [Stenotrophomonas maltophilia]MBH1651570.1 hypothetical protein [Stenotrophomonas maltophilia]QGM01244.1 hypothetical protein FEO89_11015 [Stenotrophomonas maltophilia]